MKFDGGKIQRTHADNGQSTRNRKYRICLSPDGKSLRYRYDGMPVTSRKRIISLYDDVLTVWKTERRSMYRHWPGLPTMTVTNAIHTKIFRIMRQIDLPYPEQEELPKNSGVLSRNHDDHRLIFRWIDKSGSMAPAYDLCYSYTHQA